MPAMRLRGASGLLPHDLLQRSNNRLNGQLAWVQGDEYRKLDFRPRHRKPIRGADILNPAHPSDRPQLIGVYRAVVHNSIVDMKSQYFSHDETASTRVGTDRNHLKQAALHLYARSFHPWRLY